MLYRDYEDPLNSPPKYSYLVPRMEIIYAFIEHLVNIDCHKASCLEACYYFSFGTTIVKTHYNINTT